MTRWTTILAILIGLVPAWCPADEAAPTFTRKPIARRVSGPSLPTPLPGGEGNWVRIEFAVSRATDVAVAIEDAKGAVVRHLAAGLLGRNAPPPLKKDSLAQDLLWDRNDDVGQPAVGGPFRIRVRLGMAPSFDRLIGASPSALGGVCGLAVAPNGELVVITLAGNAHSGDATTLCKVFSREGKYLRTIMPYPASVFPDKVKGFGVLDLGAKGRYPFVHHGENRCIYPLARQALPQTPVVTPDGRFIQTVIGWQNGGITEGGSGLVCPLAISVLDGSSPDSGVLGPVLTRGSGYVHLAVSPDGQTFYAAGLTSGSYSPHAGPDKRLHHVVYRFKWDDREPTIFAGTLNTPGADDKHFSTPLGLATDRDGNVYVADRDNNRIAVFTPQGALLGQVATNRPESIAVHPKTGAIYVIGGPKINEIRTFASWKESKPSASLNIPFTFRHDNYTAMLALDATADRPLLWVGAGSGYAGFLALRIEDQGDGFGQPVDIARLAGLQPAVTIQELSVDRWREEVYVGGIRFDGRSGERTKVQPPRELQGGLVVGLDGNVYVQSQHLPDRKVWKAGPYQEGDRRWESCWSTVISRFDHEFRPLPFSGTGSNQTDLISGTLHLVTRSQAITREGDIYVLHEYPGATHGGRRVSVFGADGKFKARPVEALTEGASSIRVDLSGNMYVAEYAKPAGAVLPDAFRGRMPEGKQLPGDCVVGYPGWTNWYPLLYGSLIKFGPSGGAIWAPHPKVDAIMWETRPLVGHNAVGVPFGPSASGQQGLAGYGAELRMKGILWQYLGVSPFATNRPQIAGWTGGCSCSSPRFDVDDFGRVFLPDAVRCRVLVLDTAGNALCTFGTYGNQDPASAADSDVRFAWPANVGVSDEAVYVGDPVNQRITRVRLACESDEACPVP